MRSREWYAANRETELVKRAAYRAANPEKTRASSREWRTANPDKVRAVHLRRYGLTLAQWESLFDSQGRKCGACQSTEPKHKRGWHTDHDHVTGAVRGILCHRCNVTLGNLGDSAEGVAAGCAALSNYLNQNSSPARAEVLSEV